MFVVCIGGLWKACSEVGSAGCVVQLMCMESGLCCSLSGTEHGRYNLSCMQKLWSA